MHILSLVSILSCAVYLYLGGFVLKIQRDSRANQTFAMLCGTFAVWSFSFTFFILTRDKQTAWLWYRLSALGWAVGPALLLHFFISLSQPEPREWSSLSLLLAYLLGALFFVKCLHAPIYAKDLVLTAHGWDEVVDKQSPWTYAYLLYYSTTALGGLVMIHRWGRRGGRRQRKQADIIVATGAPTLVAVSISNVLLRWLDAHYFPGLAPILLVSWGVGMYFAITRYRLMQLSPGTAAQDIIATMADAVLLVSPQAKVQVTNPAASRLFGLEEDKLKERDLSDLFPGEPLLADQALMAQIAEGPIFAVEVSLRRDDKLLTVSLSASRIIDELQEDRGAVILLQDVSARKMLEEQLQQAVKMEAIGQLAGGLAHDFNNLLMVIRTYAQLLLDEGSEGKLGEEAGTVILQATERAEELTGQLLGFARRGKHRMVCVSLRQTIKELVALLQRTIDKRITIRQSMPAEDLCVMGDPGQIQHALLNIALNARDAMPQGGTLTFRAESLTIAGGRHATFPGIHPGIYVAISVSDTGVGISPEIRSRIFEPFFTTKGPGGGTGMGLAMVYGIVKNHGGEVQVDSEPGRGSTFCIYLPRVDCSSRYDDLAKEEMRSRSSASLLMLDDEELVCRAARRMLESLGHTVKTFTDPVRGLEHLRASDEEIDLVLLDMMMPGMSGETCFSALRKIDPVVPVILISGYALDGAAQRLLDAGARMMLQKPFRIDQLSEAIDAVLAERAGDGP